MPDESNHDQPQSPKPATISRRGFLRLLGLGAAELALASCKPQEVLTQESAKIESPTPTPKQEPTPQKPGEPATEQKSPINTSGSPAEAQMLQQNTEVPAAKELTLEELQEKWGGIYFMGVISGQSETGTGGEGIGGPQVDLGISRVEAEQFTNQITARLTAEGRNPQDYYLFLSRGEGETDKYDKPIFVYGVEDVKNLPICALIFSKSPTEENCYSCAFKQNEELHHIDGTPAFKPSEAVWGKNVQERFDTASGKHTLLVEGTKEYEVLEVTPFGGLVSLKPLNSQSGEKPLLGYLAAANYSDGSGLSYFFFNLDAAKFPTVPAGKGAFDETKFTFQTDLLRGKIHIYGTQPFRSEQDYLFPYIGAWDLNKGVWEGFRSGYEQNYQMLFKDKELNLGTAPKIEGLQAAIEMNAIVYRATKENPYGLKEGELAGLVEAIKTIRKAKLAEVDSVASAEEMGVLLDPKVLVYHLLKNNRPEQLASGEWKTVMSFDPIGSMPEIVEAEVPGRTPEVYVRGIDIEQLKKLRILSMCPSKASVKSYPKVNFYPSIAVTYPDSLTLEKGTDWGFSVYFATGSPLVDNFGKLVNFGEPLLVNISGEIDNPNKPRGTQLLFLTDSLKGQKKVTLDNFLSFDGKLAFIFDKSLRDSLATS